MALINSRSFNVKLMTMCYMGVALDGDKIRAASIDWSLTIRKWSALNRVGLSTGTLVFLHISIQKSGSPDHHLNFSAESATNSHRLKPQREKNANMRSIV